MKLSADSKKQTSLADITSQVRAHLGSALFGIESPCPGYRGKVRDVFFKGNELIIVTTDRISAFDVVLGAIPLKGAFLTEQAVFWLEKSRHIIQNHLLERLDDQVMRCQKAEPFPVEIIVRGYLAGSLLRESPDVRGNQYGLSLDPSLSAYAQFNEPIITPTTKEAIGKHDMPISPEEIVCSGRVSKRHMDEISEISLALFKQGSLFAKEQGLLLVDTKYEFGLLDDKIILIDEIHTADSSRFWLAASYQDRLKEQKQPEMLDKEFLRETLLQKGFDGNQISAMPKVDEDMSIDLASRYWQLTEVLLGKAFKPSEEPAASRVQKCILAALPQT